DNTLVAYAAKGGTAADDGPAGKHSPFTEVLLKHIATPGLEINFVFRRVRDGVLKTTAGGQEPHGYLSLGAPEFFPQPATKAPEGPTGEKKEEWQSQKKDLAKLKAQAAPKPQEPSPAEDIVKLKGEIARLESKVKQLEAVPPSPGTAPPLPAPKIKREARPD